MLDTSRLPVQSEDSMVPRRFTTWQKLTVLVPVLLLVVVAPGQELLRCQMDGILRASCCCPADKEAKSGNATAVLKTQGCCDRTATADNHPPAETTRTVHDQVGSTSFAALVAPVTCSLDRRDRDLRVRQSHGPPRDGPSVLLLKSAFLI
jgi:hypothetical protein